jgi:hypothetical protein
MTLPRLAALASYWQDHPPTHIIAAGMAGVKAKPKVKGGQPEFALLPEVEEGA